VRGHQVSNQKDDIDRLFTLVDRVSRNALRGEVGEEIKVGSRQKEKRDENH
jgi:hypothetical protein